MSGPVTGFLEESPGVRSMTRLCALLMACGALLLLLTICAVALWKPDATVIASLAAPLVPLAGGLWGALRERTTEAP